MAYTPSVASASFPSRRARWAARLGLIVYAALLSVSFLAPSGRARVAGAGLFDLRTGARIRDVALALAIDLVVSFSRNSFDPWWLWLMGVLVLGALSIAGGILLWLENRKTE